MVSALPEPARNRWQPLRGGLINLYLYDRLELVYEDGRLLLRGNNGTGKSRILALQLPFLLDGEILPARVEPDGDPSKRIEWHLLMDGRYPDRVGYTWLELGRRDADGGLHYRTIGCGMKAVQGKGAPARWFFVTDLRVGVDLDLETAARVPLGKRRLEEVLADRGQVLERAADYRAALDQTFFLLGDQRYQALVDLLIQLRRPQLSRKLDEEALSKALSEALPPLSETVLGDVAEAFRGLEADRAALDGHRAALAATDTFLASYRRYVQIATRRRADALRTAHSAYEQTQRGLREAEDAAQDARARLDALADVIDASEREKSAADEALRALEDDPLHRDARKLDEARQACERAEGEAARAGAEHRSAKDELERCIAREKASLGELDDARRRSEEASARCLELAQHADCAGLLEPLGRASVDRRLEERVRHVEHLIERAEKVRAAERGLSEARRAREREEAELEGARERREERAAARDAEHLALERAMVAWAGALEVLARPDVDALRDAIALFAETGDGLGPITDAVTSVYEASLAALANERARAEASHDAVSKELDDLLRERARIERGEHQPPAAPAWRDAPSREGRAGAPLWALCDFREDVPEPARAGLEAALEGSGLLDAWVTPEGGLLGADVLDASLVAGAALDGPTLADHLVPAVDREDERARLVTDEVVLRVLSGIGAAEGVGRVWVASDGRFELGPLHGTARKASAEHVGQGAREHARRRRLRELAQRIDELESERRRIASELDRIGLRAQAAARERASAPREERLRDALSALVAADGHVRERAERHRGAQEMEERAREERDREREECEVAARDLGLSAWIDRAGELRERLRELDRALDALWHRMELTAKADAHHREHARATEETRARREHRGAVEREAVERAGAARARYDTLSSTLGASIDELQRKMAEARARRDDLRAKLHELSHRRDLAIRDEAKESSRAEALRPQLASEDERRRAAAGELQALARTGLFGTLGAEWRELDTELDWSPTAAIEVARKLDRALRGVSGANDEWDRASSRLHQRVTEPMEVLLTKGLSPTATQSADVLVVTVPYQGRLLTPDLLRENLADEIGSRERILDERERTILENHLVGEVAIHLHERIREGERLVAEMNREVESRPLSTGMRLRFRWEPRSDEPEVVAARKRLLAAQGVWSPDDRKALGELLLRRIQAERAAQQTGTWREHLERALDYRRWHHFGIERRQDDRWVRLTRRTYGTGSGGEKAIALTLPLLAAAAAHYRSASPEAPRLILMDEAFVGVDSDMRAKCMGLLAAFDLDFVMTSEREWGCYSTVPALAIYQLVTRPGLDAVHATRWIWNGHERRRDGGDEPARAMG